MYAGELNIPSYHRLSDTDGGTLGVDAPLYAFSLTLPTIVQNLGFETAAEANLVSIPVTWRSCS